MKLTTALALAMALTGTASAQGFAFMCDHGSFKLHDGHRAKAKCHTKHSTSRTTTLDLDRCFGNHNGALRRQDNGKYSGSCRQCQMNPGTPTEMWCQCKSHDSHFEPTKIDLNDHLANHNGFLCCKTSICGKEANLVDAAFMEGDGSGVSEEDVVS